MIRSPGIGLFMLLLLRLYLRVEEAFLNAKTLSRKGKSAGFFKKARGDFLSELFKPLAFLKKPADLL